MRPARAIRGVAAIVALCGGLATTRCDDDPTAPAAAGPPHLRFDALAAGQESRYLFFRCTEYGNPAAATQTYHADTLVMAVVAADPLGGFRVTEALTPGSVSRSGAGNVYDPDSVYTYRLVVEDDSLFVVPDAGTFPWSSSRIFSPPNDRFALAAIDSPTVGFDGWQPDWGYHESLRSGGIEQHLQFGDEFNELNLWQDNRPMQVDGSGALFAYAGRYGLVRFATYSWWTRSGHGWDLLGQ